LAAYIDKRLSPEQRAVVEAQLAADADSYALLVEVMKAQDALGTAAAVQEKRTTRSWAVAGSVLAIAATLALVVWTSPGILNRLRGDRVDPRLEGLVAAVGDERYVEARLTGGFKYGALRSVSRGAASPAQQNLALVAAAGELQKQAKSNPTAENLHAWGVAQLLLRDVDGAIESLEAAALEQPQSATYQTDLAGAYLTRFQTSANAQDLPRALETIDRARLLKDPPVEALFTRALILELMKLDDMATAAWRDYLSRDTASEWSTEARRRLDRLTSSKPLSRWNDLQRQLADKAAPQSVEREVVAEFPEEVPDLLFGLVIPAWAESLSGRDTQSPAMWLDRARALMEQLVAVGGDPTLLALVHELESPRSAFQAADFVALGRGIQELDGDRYGTAAPLLTTAHASFPVNSLPRRWAAFYLARVQMFLNKTDNALALLQEAGVDDSNETPQHPQLIARASWMRGIIRFTQGQHDAARRDYERTIALHESAHEPRAAATALMNLSVVYRFWGDRDRSWHYRSQGLAAMPRHHPNRYYGFLTSTAISASLDDFPNAAVSVIDEAVIAADALAPNIRAESRLQRARLRARVGLMTAARNDLASAERFIGEIEDTASRTRTEASLQTAKAEVLQDVDPQQAALMAHEAGEAFSARGDALRSAELALYEARSRSNLGDDAGALAAVASGIASFETARAAIPSDDPSRLSSLEPAWALFDEDFAWRIKDSNFNRESAFRAYEASRARTVLESRSLAPLAWTEARQALSPSVVLMLMHQRDRELVVWRISSSTDSVVRIPWPRTESTRLVDLCRREVRREGPSPASAIVREELFGEFFRSVPDGGTIIIVADGAFHQMPWAGLRDRTGTPAVTHWAFAVSPSASLALRRIDPSRSASALVVGVSEAAGMPRLPTVPEEAREVAALYDRPRVLIDQEATADAVLAAFQGSNVIHIAAHALDSPTYPLLSRLLLAGPDESAGLTAGRIASEARVNGAIVVLAACNTIGAALRRGEGTVGLAWAFLIANATSVIGSLWTLDDTNSARLFIDLHSGLNRGLGPAAALRAAQLMALRRGAAGGDWAAVQAIGHP